MMQADFWAITAVVCLGLLFVFKAICRSRIKKSKLKKIQADVLKHTQQEILRLEESIRVRTREVEDAVLSGYENKQARAHLLGLVSINLRVPVDEIIREAGLMVCAEKSETVEQEIILRSAIRLRSLVDDLIKYSQPDAHLHFLQPPAVNLSPLLTGIAAEAQRFTKINDNHFDVFPEPEILSQVSDFIKMGAVSDLMDWASSFDARHASWSRFAGVVAELAGNGDLQGLSNLLQISKHALAAKQHELENTQ